MQKIAVTPRPSLYSGTSRQYKRLNACETASFQVFLAVFLCFFGAPSSHSEIRIARNWIGFVTLFGRIGRVTRHFGHAKKPCQQTNIGEVESRGRDAVECRGILGWRSPSLAEDMAKECAA